MAALWETAVRRRTWQDMLCAGLWNGDTSLLFGAGRQPPTSTRCSPVTYSYTSSLYSITSKLSLIPFRDTIQRVGVLPTLRKSSPSSKLLKEQHSTIWWTDTCPWHGLKTTLLLTVVKSLFLTVNFG
jgi:hypothetical protein